MMKRLFFYTTLLFNVYFSVGQCGYIGTPLTQSGATVSFCIDNTNTQTSGAVNAGQYLLVNVVSGFQYRFSVGNVFTGGSDNESLTLLNASDNSLASAGSFSSALSGTTFLWTATFSGQIKVLLSRNCTNDNSAGGVITSVLVAVGNNFDSQTASGTNTWVGHVYNWSGGVPPGGSTSPNTPATITPFSGAEYVGYYNIATETINEGFGGNQVCLPVLTNGVNRTSVYTEQYAVRYRMQSTRVAGCYLLTMAGDDGVRLYVDNVLVASRWQDQGTNTFTNILVYLNGNSTILLDYYENAGGNQVNFSLTPFISSSNTITTTSPSVCSGVSSFLDGSNYAYNGGTANPSMTYQWQESADNAIFTDVSGATSEDYTPPVITTFTNITRYYRRVLRSATNASSCSFTSVSIAITTNAESSSGPCFPLTTAVYSFCIDNANTIVTGFASAGSFANLNVVKGFTYTFSVADVFAGSNENLTILDGATNTNVTPSSISSGANGVSVTWVSSLSGVIKIVLTKGAFVSDGSTGGPITMVLNAVGNTQDSQTAFGTNQWVGHMYNYSGSFSPGGSTSPNPISNITPFTNAEYVGYYTIPTQNFVEGFGGNDVCFPVLTNGVSRTSILTDRFAVRYRMRSTLSGCFLASFDGDDGVRIYVDGALVFSEWKDQSPTNYGNILLTLNGNNDIVIDFYENRGLNVINFTMVPFAATSNTIAGASSISVCTGNSPGVLNGSSYAYTGGTVNPTIVYQWQASVDGTNFTDISGATSEDYTPPTQTTTTSNIVIYYRRRVTAAIPSACVFFTSAVKVTTSPVSVLANPIISGSVSICPTSSQAYTCSAVTDASNYNWVVPTGWTVISGAGTTSIIVLSGSSAQSGNVSVTATNGCGSSGAVSYAVAITQPVIWNGTSFNAAENNINRPIIFNGNYTSPTNTVIAACDCTVNGSAVVTITSGSSMTLQNEINVNAAATMTFQNNAPLVQINDGPVNTGIVQINRNSSALMRLDYTLWSSPVAAQNLLSFSPLTFNAGPSNIRFYTYNTTLNFYDKINNVGSTNFAVGKGYLIRMPNNHPTTPTVWNGVFNGVPNNGIISAPISYVSATQIYNTVGNPYASPINITSFVSANTANINGTLRFWRKTNTNTANTGYSTWNGGIFVGGPNFNTSGNPGNVMQTGQGFMVEAKSGATAVVFNNSMRVLDSANQFFKSSNANQNKVETPELDYVWLNLLGTTEQKSQMAVGYRAAASNDVDGFDALTFNDSQMTLSSIINNNGYTIESRAQLNGATADVIPLQVRTPSNGTYIIELDHSTGFLQNQDTKIYLKDKSNSLLIDLKQSGYSFSAAAGNFKDRFELQINTKGMKNELVQSASFAAYKDTNDIVLNSGISKMVRVTVYDLLGRLYYENANVNASELRFPGSRSNEVLIIKATLSTGELVVKKVLN